MSMHLLATLTKHLKKYNSKLNFSFYILSSDSAQI